MAINYKNIGGVGKYAFTCLAGCQRTNFGIVLQSLDISNDADFKNILDENGVTVGQIVKDSKTTLSLNGYLAGSQDNLPVIGDIVNLCNSFNIRAKNMADMLERGIVSKVDLKASNEDMQQVSIEIISNPEIDWSVSSVNAAPAMLSLDIPQGDDSVEL